MPPSVLNTVSEQSFNGTWAELAFALAQSFPDVEEPLTGGELSASSLLQRVGVSVIRATTQDIDGLDARLTGAVDKSRAELSAPVVLDSLWTLWPGLRSSSAHIVLGVQKQNPALIRGRALFGSDQEIRYVEQEWSLVIPPLDVEAEKMGVTPIYELLCQPFREHPDSLADQLLWVIENWSDWLDADLRRELLIAVDTITEERRARFFGRGPAMAPQLRGPGHPDDIFGRSGRDAAELADIYGWHDGGARFSDDSDWMANLILVAKHTYVWLDQLSKRYGETIERLDQIPEDALHELAKRGFTGLWLIGLWERSNASKEIKRRRGNSEAEASAYALDDYAIAQRLGGEDALTVLRERATRCGLRLAADMVPNHVGMDGRWIVEHPDRFLQLPRSPFPSYTFNGPNLSQDSRVGVYLEDGYWNETDAAVCFKRVDHQTGAESYIYHGNDGTQMPWNDTAQLDYLKPEVREVVIQTIVGVAKRFPIIRFDAAMTLARRHIERLWYPAPGHGGAIPSRAANSVPPEVFAQLMPTEFWSDVVDRIRAEVPDTLLLAEAFWMMEGYFVRTLGMHRVYNSAFMHMLRDEDNDKYRGLIKETLEYNPQILDRYVNFMNNPDEDTAVEQFGKGDKYFGVATLMATLPGLPMFGHGQFEGYSEKYGMEFAKAYWDETPDQGLLDYHAQVITPILKARHLFSGVSHFALFDFYANGGVDENVFAYTNRGKHGHERSLVVYNNAHTSSAGWLKTSSAINVGTEAEPHLIQRSLSEALGLDTRPTTWYGIYELRSKAWYLRRASELANDGLFVGVQGYEAQVFMHFREIHDADGHWSAFAEKLNGRAVSDLEAEFQAFAENRIEAEFIRNRGPRPYPQRCAGVLMHPSSLSGPEGIGTLGASAIGFLDWMVEAGLSVWQVLPLCPGGPGESPYSSPASVLGNPLLIDLTALIEPGLLTPAEVETAHVIPSDRVDFGAVKASKMPLLALAASRLVGDVDHPWHNDWVSFCESNAFLTDAVLFQAIKAHLDGAPWWEWPVELKQRNTIALEQITEELKTEIEQGKAIAFFFDRQWAFIRGEAESRGIHVFGDLPIYVSHDSADVWSNQAFFAVDENGAAEWVAGVPPDLFSETGQLWGNPLYDWAKLKADGYQWWIDRIERALQWTPMIRLDHFRGFSAYYAVEGTAETAMEGTWIKGPGCQLFNALDRALGVQSYIAEDLGEIDDAVHELRRDSGMICMRILQFGLTDPYSIHRPAACPTDAVVYTGTHDNDTTLGWWDTLDAQNRALVAQSLECSEDGAAVVTAMIDAALATPSQMAVIPLQDILGLDGTARMNIPGVGNGNWSWRLTLPPASDLASSLRSRIRKFDR